MDPSSSTASGPNGRQKRVLPSRTRRGGPTVGHCDTDIMILEHHKRRFETEAIIPPTTQFLLTTNSKIFSTEEDSADPSLTTVTSERYFDRPDVLKAYREQLTIQTPSFTYVADNPSVGGRFRPRGPEDAQIDTSDSAYERRHRKYETFEKRQRLREKEKLKHEQYKLKERIEQLRIMDASAFLALPAENFSPTTGTEEDEEDVTGTSHLNGSSPYGEGERRRKEMMDIALALEARYKVLLPPNRVIKAQPQTVQERTTKINPYPAVSRAVSDAVNSDWEDDYYYDRKNEIPKIKLKLGGNASSSQSPAPTNASRSSRRSVTRASAPPSRGRRHRTYVTSRSSTPLEPPNEKSEITVTYISSEPQSPQGQPIDIENDDEEPPILEYDKVVFLPPVTPIQRSAAVPADDKSEVELIPTPPHSPSSLLPEEPPQKQTPIPDTRPAPAPELNPVPFDYEAGRMETEEEPLIPEEELSPRDTPASLARSSHVNESKGREMDTSTPPARRSEETSRLLELANAVHALTMSPPMAKRQKNFHEAPAHLESLPDGEQLLPDILETTREDSSNNLEPIPEVPPSEPMSISPKALDSPTIPTISMSNIVSGPAIASRSSVPPRISTPVPISDPLPPSATTSTATTGPKRRNYTGRQQQKAVSYKSLETGETEYTNSLLLIAGIRGSQRQTQRHQMAFGVKVPEDISEMRDFWLPDEFLPEEELIKYYGYYGLEAPLPPPDAQGSVTPAPST